MHACERCGDFICAACARSIRKVAIVYCPACLERREAYLAEGKLGGGAVNLRRTAVVCGVISMIPCLWPVWIGAIVLGIMCLVAASREGGQGRVEGLVALAGAGVGVAGTVAIFMLAGT